MSLSTKKDFLYIKNQSGIIFLVTTSKKLVVNQDLKIMSHRFISGVLAPQGDTYEMG